MNCPCSSGKSYELCCQRYHQQQQASTAAELMRSRYSAYVLGEVEYLVRTTHPSQRTPSLQAGYQATHDSIRWLGLELLSTFQGTETDKTGKVEFKASYTQDGRHLVHHETSRFKRHGGHWHYLDGEVCEQEMG